MRLNKNLQAFYSPAHSSYELESPTRIDHNNSLNLTNQPTTPLHPAAGNDASIKLWDLSRAHPTTKAPRAVASLDVRLYTWLFCLCILH